jgi:hypothetical protein
MKVIRAAAVQHSSGHYSRPELLSLMVDRNPSTPTMSASEPHETHFDGARVRADTRDTSRSLVAIGDVSTEPVAHVRSLRVRPSPR